VTSLRHHVIAEVTRAFKDHCQGMKRVASSVNRIAEVTRAFNDHCQGVLFIVSAGISGNDDVFIVSAGNCSLK
jgi:hypothetical protein